jgi:plastocyanin
MIRRYVAIALLLVGSVTVTYAKEFVVGQKGKLFSPGAVAVKTGDVLLFQNDDAVTHHIYSSTKGREFSLETLHAGKSAKHTFATKGRVDVRCGLHPGMRLVVTVE